MGATTAALSLWPPASCVAHASASAMASSTAASARSTTTGDMDGTVDGCTAAVIGRPADDGAAAASYGRGVIDSRSNGMTARLQDRLFAACGVLFVVLELGGA